MFNFKANRQAADNKDHEYILIQNEQKGRRMGVEINKPSDMRLSSAQEMKLTKSTTNLPLGQTLKTMVIGPLGSGEVLIDIDGKRLSAQTPYQFAPGDLLEVNVSENDDQIILEVTNRLSSRAILQSALLETLTKQGPATGLLQTISQINKLTNIPESIAQQIKNLIASITPL